MSTDPSPTEMTFQEYAAACRWDVEERAAFYRSRGFHPAIAAIMAEEDIAKRIRLEKARKKRRRHLRVVA